MTKHLVNPSGVVHDVPDDHPGVRLAESHQEGWRFATDDEARAMYERQGVPSEEWPEELRPKKAEASERAEAPEGAEAKPEERLRGETAKAGPPSGETAKTDVTGTEASKVTAPKTEGHRGEEHGQRGRTQRPGQSG